MELASFLNFWRKSPSTQLTNRWSHQWLFISLKDWRSTVENHKDFNFVNYSPHFCPKQFWAHFDKYIFENEHLWTLNICEFWAFLSFSSVHWATIISAIEVWRYELHIWYENVRKAYMSQLLLLGKVENGGGPILKVVRECWKRCSEPFLIYIYGIQCDFMPKSCWKHSNFENR